MTAAFSDSILRNILSQISDVIQSGIALYLHSPNICSNKEENFLAWPWENIAEGLGQQQRRRQSAHPQSDQPLCLYPRHLCRGVYSFRLSVRPFVCSFVRSFVRSFVLPSVAWNLRQSFALKFLKWCISQQLLIRKHSYLDHSYPWGLAFTPWPRTPGSMPRGGARGQNLGHLKKCIF